MDQSSPHCHHCEPSPRPNKKLLISLGAALLVYLVSFIPALEPLQTSFVSYFKMIWWAILLGLLLGGVIDHFVPDAFIYRFMGGNKRGSIFSAVIAGFILSACSHGILALAIQLHKKGAGIPAVIAFLLAAPWANLPVTILLFTFFGWKAFLFIGGAMGIALISGFIFMGLERSKLIENSPTPKEGEKADWSAVKNFQFKAAAKGVWAGALSLANMVVWWIVIGFMAAIFIQAYVPSHIFMDYFGPSISGLLLTLLAATIIEVCSEGSAPIAFEIFRQVGTLGNPFVFLMAGVVTDYTEIGLLWTNVGKKTALWLPVVTVPQVVALGMVFNLYF